MCSGSVVSAADPGTGTPGPGGAVPDTTTRRHPGFWPSSAERWPGLPARHCGRRGRDPDRHPHELNLSPAGARNCPTSPPPAGGTPPASPAPRAASSPACSPYCPAAGGLANEYSTAVTGPVYARENCKGAAAWQTPVSTGTTQHRPRRPTPPTAPRAHLATHPPTRHLRSLLRRHRRTTCGPSPSRQAPMQPAKATPFKKATPPSRKESRPQTAGQKSHGGRQEVQQLQIPRDKQPAKKHPLRSGGPPKKLKPGAAKPIAAPRHRGLTTNGQLAESAKLLHTSEVQLSTSASNPVPAPASRPRPSVSSAALRGDRDQPLAVLACGDSPSTVEPR